MFLTLVILVAPFLEDVVSAVVLVVVAVVLNVVVVVVMTASNAKALVRKYRIYHKFAQVQLLADN